MRWPQRPCPKQTETPGDRRHWQSGRHAGAGGSTDLAAAPPPAGPLNKAALGSLEDTLVRRLDDLAAAPPPGGSAQLKRL
ncbi:MAG: hypothetical protein HC889_13960 [Synechococcaceae cyanobacterium SM1_2_3]|nr:hypothetical protein [Synechococcaceae cyanobacterium SM1_2_3]